MNTENIQSLESNHTSMQESIDTIQKQLSELIDEKNKQAYRKPLGKFHDVYLLIIGFTLTAMVGGFISYIYQKKMFDYQKQAINYENKQREMSDFYKGVSDIITSRYLYARRLATALHQKQGEKIIEMQREKYYHSVDEWSKNDAYNRAFIHNSFSDSLVFLAYSQVAKNFTGNLHDSLYRYMVYPQDTMISSRIATYLNDQNSMNQDFFTVCSKYVFPAKEDE
jgi:hypothetical protein